VDGPHRLVFASSRTARRPTPALRAVASPTSALTLLIGDRSLVVGRENGAVEVWFPQLLGNRSRAPSRAVVPELRGPRARAGAVAARQGFLALDAAGGMALMYSTSERTLWSGRAPVQDATSIAYAPKADGALVAGAAGAPGSRSSPASRSQFESAVRQGLVRGIREAGYSWQSSSGTEDFEPKLSLTPLLYER